MIKLNRKVEYALIALKHLNSKSAGELSTAKELSLFYGVPFDVVSRVLQILNQNGIVKSHQGAQGGYDLIKNLNEISFQQLVEMIEGPLYLVKCLHDSDGCELKTSCNIISPLNVLNTKLKDFYQTIKISDLILEKRKKTIAEEYAARI